MNSSTALLSIPPTVNIGDHVKLQRGRTGIVKFVGCTKFSNGREVIGLQLDTYDPNAHDGKGYFNTPKGRGYFTQKHNISNIIVSDDTKNNQSIAQHKLVVKLKNRLREIEILEYKHKYGIFLHPAQLAKIKRKHEYETQLETVQKIYINGLSTSALIDSDLINSNKQLITVQINDSVRIKTGKTGIIKYIGPVSVMSKEKQLIGIVMDQSDQRYGNGTIDDIQYFDGPKNRCYFIRPEEITYRFVHDKISLNKQEISMTINQRYAEIVYSFDFENRCDLSKELKFEITVASDAFISSFVADIDGVLFHGNTKEKQEAKQQYETAKQKQENAILISQPYDDIPNVFMISTNIDSKSEISLQITIEQYIKKQFNFNQLKVQVLKSFNENIIMQQYDKIPFELHLFDSRGLCDVSMQNVTVVTQKNMNESNTYCSVNGSVQCDEDSDNELILKYKVSGEQSDSNVLYDDKTGTFCHIISDLITDHIRAEGDTNELKDENICETVLIPRRVVFVLDRSGSMCGKKWDKAIASIVTTLQQLRHKYDRYCVVLFDDDIELLSQQMIVANKSNIFKSISDLKTKSPNGRTDINAGLLKAIELIKNDITLLNKRGNDNFYMNQICVITDGEPNCGVYDTTQIISNVKMANTLTDYKYCNKISIFAFGVGRDCNDSGWVNDLNHQFLKLLAVNNNGLYQRIKRSTADTVLGEFLQILSKPILSNIKLKYTPNNKHVSINNLTQTTFNTLYSGNDIIICGQIEQPNNIQNSSIDITATITAITGKQIRDKQSGKFITKPINITKQIEINLSVNDFDNDVNNIERIWAYLTLQQYSEKRLMFTDMIEYDNEEKKNDDSLPLSLAMKYKFVTPWTSMIVVKEKQDLYEYNNEPMPVQSQYISISNTISLRDGSAGVVKYIGNTDFSDGREMVGVELDNWCATASNGTDLSEQYFTSCPGRGYFARMCSITDWNIPSDLLEEAKMLDEENKEEDGYNDEPIDETQNSEVINVNIGDRIITMNGYEGIVKYIGDVHFNEREMIGIELNRWIPNGSNGIIHGHKYYNCKDGRGLFILKNGVKRNLGNKKDKTAENIKLKSIKNMVIGDRVKLRSGKCGIVKYLGGVKFTSDDMVGIVLDYWSANGHDGTVRGIQYFKASKGMGYFVRRKNIIQVEGIVDDDENGVNIKIEILRIEYVLRQIQVLKLKKVNGMSLNSHEIAEMKEEKDLMNTLTVLKNQMKCFN